MSEVTKNEEKVNISYGEKQLFSSPLMAAVNIKTAIKKLEAEKQNKSSQELNMEIDMKANESKNYTKIGLSGGYFGGAESFRIEKLYYEHLQLATAIKLFEQETRRNNEKSF